MPSLLEKAIQIALTAHSGAERRNGTPYILHPLRVMSRVDAEDAKIVAVLHDVVEDTHWTLDDLKREGYPDHILAALDCVTKRAGEPYEDFIDRAASNPLARRVKIADLEDNMNLAELPEVTPRDEARMEKYQKAWKRLMGPKAVISSNLFSTTTSGNQLSWSSAIGIFLTNYATLDYMLFHYLESRLSAEELASLKKKHFKDRVQRVSEFIAAGNDTVENKAAFEDFVKRLEPVRTIRNHIAHGHLLLRMSDDAKTLTYGIALPRDLDTGSEPATRLLTLAELQTYSRELVALIEFFQPFAGFKDEV